MNLLRYGIVAGVALTFAGCGLSASPADGLTFRAPAGWQSSPGIMGLMQFWRSPQTDREILMLFKSPKALKPSDVFTDARFNNGLKDTTIENRSSIQICDHQPATLVQARGTSTHGDERVDLMLTTLNGNSYFALYVRPLGMPPNPMAEAALRELCAKP